MAFDVKKAIKDLGDIDFSKSNEEQGKAAQLFKGLAFSDDPISNKFMKMIDNAATAAAKKVLGESVDKVVVTEDEIDTGEEAAKEVAAEDEVAKEGTEESTDETEKIVKNPDIVDQVNRFL